MNKKDWIKWALVILVVFIVPGGFLLAGYAAKKKLEKKEAEEKASIAVGERTDEYDETKPDSEIKDSTITPATQLS